MSVLFADGGVIKKNPSLIGGTWAFREVTGDHVINEASGFITPMYADVPSITNNLTEMLAVIRALQSVPKDWHGFVNSDSQITLGRVFKSWKWTGIPEWLHEEYRIERRRLTRWDKIQSRLLSGHPTKAELFSGIGHNGNPVSEHNVWCDKQCGIEAKKYLALLEANNE